MVKLRKIIIGECVISPTNFRRSTGGSKLDSILEGRMGWFTIFHVKATKKVTSILRLGKKNSFIGLKNLEAKEMVQKA
jgi:hypothetical protein